MKVPVNWLRDYVPLEMPLDDLATRLSISSAEVEGIERLRDEHVAAARALEMRVKLVGEAVLVGERVGVRVGPAFVDAHHPLAAVEGAFNAVMLQGDAIREITLEGPGAGGIETASAIVADLVSVLGASEAGFLRDDPVWRALDFQIDEPTLFQYSYRGSADGQSFEAKAVGDLDCDGVFITYELAGTISGGNPTFTLTEPALNAD